MLCIINFATFYLVVAVVNVALYVGLVMYRCCCRSRSEDAADAPADRICPICNMTFSMSDPEELFISHVEDHVVKVCPVCTQEFQPDDANFVVHVNMCVASNEQEQQAQQQQQIPEPLDMEMIV